MADLESDRVERKESLQDDSPARVREAVCAFANDLPDHRRAGVVFVGADDDGRPGDIAITDEPLRRLADVKTDGNIVPPPTLTVGKHRLFGQDVAVVTVRPSDSPPVRYRGRTWIRVGPHRAVASAQDERILNEKRRHRDPHFDAWPVRTAGLADPATGRFEDEYLPAAIDPEALAANDRTAEERLAAAKMIVSDEDPVPTVAGLLVLGKRPLDHLPGAYVQFLRVGGNEWGDEVIDEARCAGSVADVIRRLDDKLIAHNRTAVDFTSGPVETRRSTWPLGALQQLVRNAVMHRTYEGTNAPVRVYWFDDRIEIISPGGPYGAVTADLGHGADRQLPLADGHLPDLDVDPALGSDARNPILGVLREWTADDVPPVVDPVDDQPAVGHGHGRDGVANVFRDAVLEVELLVFAAAEQAPGLVDCEPPGDVAEPEDGGHGVERLSNLSRPSPRRFPVGSGQPEPIGGGKWPRCSGDPPRNGSPARTSPASRPWCASATGRTPATTRRCTAGRLNTVPRSGR